MMKRVGFYRSILVLAAGMLSACADIKQNPATNLVAPSTPVSASGEQESPAERQLSTQADELSTPVWKTATFWQATALGTVAGGMIALLQHEDTDVIFKSAAAGGAIGALIGAYIASKQQQYAGHEAMLNSMIDDVRLKNRQSEAFIGSIKQVITEDQTRLAQLDRQYKEKRITQEELNRQRAIVAADRNKIKEKIDEVTRKTQEQLEVFAGAKKVYQEKHPNIATTGLDQEIDSFADRIKAMNRIATNLSKPELG
ncbi:MAG: hypothetical protein U1F76_18140 [Candidatus Competibacteraceae bacterium]